MEKQNLDNNIKQKDFPNKIKQKLINNYFDQQQLSLIQNWIHGIAIVTFDIDEGQIIEQVYPNSQIFTEKEEKQIALIGFPDSSSMSSTQMTLQYIFKIKRDHPKSIQKQSYAFTFFLQKKVPSLQRGYLQKSLILISDHPFIYFFTNIVRILGIEYFLGTESQILNELQVQHQNSQEKHNKAQQQLDCQIEEQNQINKLQNDILLKFIEDISKWPYPENKSFQFSILDEILHLEIPKHYTLRYIYKKEPQEDKILQQNKNNDQESSTENCLKQKKLKKQFSSSFGEDQLQEYKINKQNDQNEKINNSDNSNNYNQNKNLNQNENIQHQIQKSESAKQLKQKQNQANLTSLLQNQNQQEKGKFQDINLLKFINGSKIKLLWPLWQIIMTNQSLMVVSDNPSVCSEGILSLISLISPLEYIGDFKPYFTVYDPDYRQIQEEQEKQYFRPVLVGVTNQFIIKTFKNFPVILRLDNEHEQMLQKKNKYDFSSKYMKSLVINKQFQQNVIEMVPDQQLLNKLMPGSENTDEIQVINNTVIRQYFKNLTKQFLQVFQDFFDSQQNMSQHEINSQKSIQNEQNNQNDMDELQRINQEKEKFNRDYVELLRKEQKVKFDLQKQQMENLRRQQQNPNLDQTHQEILNFQMNVISQLTNNKDNYLPGIQNTPFQNMYSQNITPAQMRNNQRMVNQTTNFKQSPNKYGNQQEIQEMQQKLEEKNNEILLLKQEIQNIQAQDNEIFQMFYKEKTEQFKQDFRKFQEEIERIQKVHQIEIEEKNRLIEQGNQLYQALSEKYEQAIKLKDQEMQEFLEFKYKPLENKVEMLKEENMVSENKVNVKTQDDFKKQQEEVKKMQIFIMSQKQELDHLRKTVQETENMKRTNQFQISMSQGDQIKNENHTYLLEQIDLLRQELNIERQKNNQMLGQQQILLPNLKQSNNYTSPANQGSQQQAEQIQKLQEEIEALKLINMNYKPIVQKVPKGQGNKLQQLKSIDEVQETNQLRKQLKGMNQKQPIDLDKKQVQEQKNQNEEEFENFDEESCIQSVKSVSMPQNQLTNSRQFVKDDKLPESQTKNLQDDSILSFEDNVDREECVKQNLLLRQYVNKLVQQNYEYQQNIGKGALSGLGGDINNLLQEKMQALINKVKELKEENRLLNEALDDKFQGEGFQNSLQDSSNVSLAKLRNENKKLKAYIQLKGNQGEDEKLKAMKYDFLEEQIDQLQIENRKLKAEINGTASKAGNYGALNQLRDVENRNAQLQENNIKLSEALRVKMQENEQLKAQGMYLSRHAKENIFNMERSYRDNYQQIERSYKENMQKHQQVNQELEKVTNVLRGKMKESDELKAAIQQFDNLMRQKNVQNEQLAQKCQQLAQALQQRVQKEQQANEVFKQNQILRQDMEKITNALKDKLRENENIKQNFKKLEQFIREREILEAELRKMKDIVELKLRENGEIRNRCQQMEGRIRQTQEIEGKMRDLQSKMRFVLTEIQSIPQKIGGLGQSQFY